MRVDPRVRFIAPGLVSGGSPWRLLRVPGASYEVLERWKSGARVGAGEERFARTLIQLGFLHARLETDHRLEDIDVVIPVRDDVASLDRLLGELSGFRTTVVDDASSDGASIAACCEAHGATLIRLEENRGPGPARNAGASAATRPLLWFVDVDVSLHDASAVAHSLACEFADPTVAAAAARVRGPIGPSRRERFEHHFGALDLGPDAANVVPRGVVSYVPSACLMVRRASFGEGFDETLRLGEDVDLVWRLHDQGWLVRYCPEAVVTHRARTSWRAWWRQRERYGESSAALARRHGSRLAPFRVDRWTLVAWTLVLFGQPALGAQIVAGARRHARDTVFAASEDPDRVAGQVVATNMASAGGPLARAIVRTFGAALLVCALHPRLRTRALALFCVGTAWRWRHHRVEVADVPLAMADDLAYGTGVIWGAWKERSLAALTPEITKSSMGLRDALGLSAARGELRGA